MPQGGNTGLVGGQMPHHGEVVLSLCRLDRIREVDPVSNTMICEAGVILQRAREAAAAADRLFPLLARRGRHLHDRRQSFDQCRRHRRARLRHRALHALGLEVVLADGRVLDDLSKLKKDNTGYDLKNLSSAPKARSASSPPRC